MKKKSIVTLCFSVVIALLLNYIAFFGFNVAGFSWDGALGDKGIKRGIDLAGGSVITFQAETETAPSDSEMSVVESILQTRLVNAGYTESRISRGDNGKVTVEIPSVYETDEAASLLGKMAKLTFQDPDGNVILDGATDIKDASYKFGSPSQSSPAQAYVQVEFTPEAKTKFAEATKAAAARSSEGKNYISIMMDETAVSSPSVHEEINSDSCVITGNFTPETAQELANQIKSGQLPFNLTVATQETVGAELGANALPTSLTAAGMLFMALMYKVPGLIADISLLFYVGIISLVLGALHVNLSLSGIAGIVLSIGMAVDADCIIFERMKEELRVGKTIKASVDAGFNKAFSAILDSNITTIISCVVLRLSNIGTVTGFATTLGIGVILSMFTAIVVTKFLLKQLVNIGIKNRYAFYRPAKVKGGAEE